MSQYSEPQSEAPTSARYIVLALLCSLSFIFYLDRVCISKAGPMIQKELNLENDHMGYVYAAFTLAYILFEIPIGIWGDRYGSRRVMTRIVIGWSIFTALTGAVQGLLPLIAVRFLFGAGEAGAFPNTARILSRWFPVDRRGMAQGMVNSASLVGGALAPIVTQKLMDLIGWRWTFAVYSLPGVVWAIVFYWWFRDDPQTHASTNDAERKLIAAGTDVFHAETHPPVPWSIVIGTPQIWIMAGILICSAANSYFYYSWYPTYLENGRGVSADLSAQLSSLVLAGGAIGGIFGGLLIDFLVKLTGNRHKSRRMWGSTALFLSAVFLLIGNEYESATPSAVWSALSLMFMISTLASWWGAVTDISGKHLGALFGLMNSVGGLGAMATQILVGKYTTYMKSQSYVGRDQWNSMFYVFAGVLVVGSIGWLFVDSSRGIEREAE